MTSIYFIEKKFINYLKEKYRTKFENKKVFVYGAGYTSELYVSPILGCSIDGYADDTTSGTLFFNKKVLSLKEAIKKADIIFLGSNKNQQQMIQNIHTLDNAMIIESFEDKELEFLDNIEACYSKAKNIDLTPSLQDIEDLEAIYYITKEVLLKNPNALICELGSWKGGSAIVIASTIMMYGEENSRVICVDNWQAPDNTSEVNEQLFNEAQTSDVHAIFSSNIINMNLNRFTESVRGTSRDIKKKYKENLFDMIFLDADHRYSFIKQDLSDMLSMLKKDGLICGHDCLGYLKDFPQEIINKNLEKDCVIFNKKLLHCGVVKACHDIFQDTYYIYQNSRVWYFSENKQLQDNIQILKKSFSNLSCASNKTPCPVCKNKTEFIYTNRSKYYLYQCESCYHIFVANLPDTKKIESFYNNNSTYEKQNYLPCNTESTLSDLKSLEDDIFIKYRMSDLNEHIPNILHDLNIYNIIEVGSLDSRVLAYLKYHSKRCTGIELNKIVAKKVSLKYGIEMHTCLLEQTNLLENSYDLIYNFHTLQHIADIKSFISKIYNLLALNGICLIHIPYNEIDYGNKDHLHIFSEKSIYTLFNYFFDNIKITKAVAMTNCGCLLPVLTISGNKTKS